MKRLLFSLALLAGPAGAQDLDYSDTATEACLGDSEGYHAQLACAGRSAALCVETTAGGSTVGTAGCLDRERAFWDDLLNTYFLATLAEAQEYDSELEDLASPAPRQGEALREMQRRWIAFRDAACAYEASQWGGGTGAGPATVECLMQQTARQALSLRLWAR